MTRAIRNLRNLGPKTEKMLFGHHGANQPVRAKRIAAFNSVSAGMSR